MSRPAPVVGVLEADEIAARFESGLDFRIGCAFLIVIRGDNSSRGVVESEQAVEARAELLSLHLHAEVRLLCQLEREHIMTIGRRGLFLQGDMHQSIEMGLGMGKRLAERSSGAATLGKLKADYVTEYVRYLEDY